MYDVCIRTAEGCVFQGTVEIAKLYLGALGDMQVTMVVRNDTKVTTFATIAKLILEHRIG